MQNERSSFFLHSGPLYSIIHPAFAGILANGALLTHKQILGRLQMSAVVHVCMLSCHSLTLCDSMNYSPPGSSVPGILQAK